MTAATPTENLLASETPITLLYPDLEQELATTRRILERVPDGKNDWRPHEKSMTLDRLATHVAQLPGLGIRILTSEEFDVTAGPRPQANPGSSAERLKMFDELSAQFVSLMRSQTWETVLTPWTFRVGERVAFRGPRAKALRVMIVTHLAHHRAQLGVYLRVLGIPIPGSYGPSADEPLPT
ncbi:MAG TPA: DinB family protein [Gemmatimonadaceae bacterium]|nr:DinB family protein [Gemmatimonadaceae bacterium]